MRCVKVVPHVQLVLLQVFGPNFLKNWEVTAESWPSEPQTKTTASLVSQNGGSELDDIFTLKREHRTAQEAFLSKKKRKKISLCAYWLWQRFGWTLQHSVVRACASSILPLASMGSLQLLPAGSNSIKNLIGLLRQRWKPLSNFLPALSRMDMWNKSMDSRNAPSVRFDFVVHHLILTTDRWMNDFWRGDGGLTRCILAASTVIRSGCADGNTLTRREEESWAVTHSFLNSTLKTSREKPVFKSASGTMSFSPPLSNLALFALSILALRSPFFSSQPSSLVFSFCSQKAAAGWQRAFSQRGRRCGVSVGTRANKWTSSCVWEPLKQRQHLSPHSSLLPPVSMPSVGPGVPLILSPSHCDFFPSFLWPLFLSDPVSLWWAVEHFSGVQPKSNTQHFSKTQPVLKPGGRRHEVSFRRFYNIIWSLQMQ